MADKICKHGEQLKLSGGGIYFLCRFDWEESGEEWRKNSPCRYVRWCQEDKTYYASVDEGGNTCLHFELLKPSLPAKKVVETKEDVEKESSSYEDEDMVYDLEIIFEDYDIDQE